MGPVDSALLRQAGWRGKLAARVHVARQARVHVCPARHGWPTWHPCHAAACGATKEACHATLPGAAKGVTGANSILHGLIYN
jgi:hypothetical protein